MYARVILGATKSVPFTQFRGVLIEGFHCSKKRFAGENFREFAENVTFCEKPFAKIVYPYPSHT